MKRPCTCYKAALRGVVFACCLLALLCVSKSVEAQTSTEPQPPPPSDILAASKNQVLAQNALTQEKLERLCKVGLGGQEHNPEAIAGYRKAAAQGNSSATNTLGWIYQCGLGVKKDYAKGIALYEKAAAEAYSPAEANLGWTYQYGIGVPQDYAQAFAWHQKAANHGNAASEDTIGSFYAFGLGVQRDYAQALVWYRRAADQGIIGSEDALGLFYLHGFGAAKDYGQSLLWFEKAAKQGDALAEDYLGDLYLNGWGVPKDYSQALAWYQKAANQGLPQAENNLCSLYQNGWGVPKDLAQALTWCLKAANQGDAIGEYNVGSFYVHGIGVPKDYSQAFAWFQKAAAQENAGAENDLGAFYVNGWDVPKDYKQALSWYQKAANQGDATGEYNVGTFYVYGLDVAKDYGQAFAWFQKAAAQENAGAENDLGWMYQHGAGVQQDNAQAIAWYQKAAAQGNSTAEKNLAALNQKIAKTQIAPASGGGPMLAQNTPARSALTGTEQQVTPTPCIPFDKINSQYTPPDLYRMVSQCIQDNDYPSAVALFVLAGMDTRFDVSRVDDKTVGDTGQVLIMKIFESIPAPAKKKFDTTIHTVYTRKSVTEYLCGWVQQVGPPTYYPKYMIMHGMRAVTAGLTKAPLQEELLPVADASGSWKTIGTNYVHCALAQQNVSGQNPQAADRYRSTIEQAIADTPAPTAPVTDMSSNPLSSSSNGNGATSDQQSPTYGPLTFNSDGADFYVAQDGKFAPASVSDGTIVIHLHSSSFQIGYNGEQVNVCLAQSPFPEVRADPSGYRASCLSGPFTGAREPNSDALLVYGGHKWSDGNTELSDTTSMKTTSMNGFQFAYQVNQLQFIEARDMTLGRFKGTLYGYIAVYKQHARSNKDIMPIHLIFE